MTAAQGEITAEAPLYLTTKEVADLLRVKERKVYDLAAADELPHRRITGKLLFPRAEIMAWIDGEGVLAGGERPAGLTGSHDPLLDWAVRESGAGLATLLNGSTEGIEVFARGEAALGGLHLPEEDGWNVRAVASKGLRDCVLIGWALRARGLILTPDAAGQVRGFGDLKGRRVRMRQEGAGASALFDMLLAEHGMSREAFEGGPTPARTESDAAAAVAVGEADAALGIEAMAKQFHLAFRPILEERFDLLIDRRAYFGEPVQRLLGFARSEAFAAKAAAMGGYDLGETGMVRWVSP